MCAPLVGKAHLICTRRDPVVRGTVSEPSNPQLSSGTPKIIKITNYSYIDALKSDQSMEIFYYIVKYCYCLDTTAGLMLH